MNHSGKPTSAELEILQILWKEGQSTVGAVHERINRKKPTTYTTVLKFMQIMHEKGLVTRDEKGKAHIYRAAVTRERTQTGMVNDLLEKVFSGSAAMLVQHVLEAKATSPEELAAIREMINEAEAKGEKK